MNLSNFDSNIIENIFKEAKQQHGITWTNGGVIYRSIFWSISQVELKGQFICILHNNACYPYSSS